MPDKSYVQALQDLQDRLSSHSLEALAHMLTHRCTGYLGYPFENR